jgi:hypothetical protein
MQPYCQGEYYVQRVERMSTYRDFSSFFDTLEDPGLKKVLRIPLRVVRGD